MVTLKLFRCPVCGTFIRLQQKPQSRFCGKCSSRLSATIPVGSLRPLPRRGYQLPFWQVVKMYWRRHINRRRYARRSAV